VIDRIALAEFTPASLVSAIRDAGYPVESFSSDSPMPSVPAAATALGVEASAILKTLIFENDAGDVIRAIACGTDRIDRKRLEHAAGIGRLKMAPPARVLETTGWPAGGVAPVGSRYPLPTWVERRVMQQVRVWGGGGTEWTLIGLDPADIVAITNAVIVDLIGD
jgi:Cys-tRNA(Pro)/Cys-tRNA(Cys) deacylase